MLVVFGLGTLVLLVAAIRVLAGDLDHGGDPSPWFVLSVFATAVVGEDLADHIDSNFGCPMSTH
jgi:hypothetical protein